MPAEYVLSHFDNTLGALLIGFAISATAFGMLSMQVFVYYRRFLQDKAAYKTLVALIWFISFVDQTFIGHAVYFYTTTNYLNPIQLTTGKPQWTLILQTTLGAVVGAIVKTCFTLRVWRFSCRNRWLAGFLFLMVFAQLGTATTFAVKCFELPSFAHIIDLRSLGSVSLSIGVVTDMSIAVALCFYLQKIRSSCSTADSVINKLIIYAVNTGILTSTVSLSTLILFNIMPTNFVFMCMYFVLSELYGISFLATLNTRTIIRDRGTDLEGGRTASPSLNIFTGSMQPSVQKPIQLPMPTIHEEKLDITRSRNSAPSLTPRYDLGW